MASHPVWVRGLKQSLGSSGSLNIWVAPRVGAWIETYNGRESRIYGLWSHPVWVRGLKHVNIAVPDLDEKGRTPCGCVD